MTDFLCPFLELMILLPGMLLAYLPMKGYLRIPPARLAAGEWKSIILISRKN